MKRFLLPIIKAKRFFLFILCSVVDFYVTKLSVKTVSNTVLVIRLDTIGDFILWLDSAKELRKLYPANTHKMILLGNQVWTSLAEKLPYFNQVWPLDRGKFIRNPSYRYRILKKVRESGFEIVIHPVYSREYHLGDAVVRTSGATKRLGFQGDHANIKPWQKRISDKWHTDLINVDDSASMELIRNAQFMRAIGLEEFRASVPALDIDLKAPDRFNLTNYYVLFPSAGWHGRKWPIQNFIEIAKRIYQKTGWTGVMCGGIEDSAMCDALLKDCDMPMFNWMGKTTLQELAAVISKAHIVVSNETSAVHIAAALSRPCVCILGGGHYGRFLPYRIEKKIQKTLPLCVRHTMDCFGCNWRCIYKIAGGSATPCIENISVDDTWNAVQKVLRVKTRDLIAV